MSFAGRELQRWQAQQVWTAGIAELPGKGGTRRLGIIGFLNGRDVPFPNSLCAYDVDGNLEQPVWERHVETQELPPRLVNERGFKGEQYRAEACRLMDIFPDEPGDEIVALFGGPEALPAPLHPHLQPGRPAALPDLARRVGVGPELWTKQAGCWSSRATTARSMARTRSPHADPGAPIRPGRIRDPPRQGAIRPEYVYQDAQGSSEDTAWYECLKPVEGVYELNPALSRRPGGG